MENCLSDDSNIAFFPDSQVVTKRRVLEATLACMEKLDTAEEIVLNVQQQNLSSPNLAADISKGKGIRRRALLK